MASKPPKDTLVYSYRRFSSGRQASGHSLERQTAKAREWCAERGYTLDESLALADLGVSAYSGDNVARGALAGFLEAARAGRIPRGSIFLVESLDRISRASLPEAITVLTSIVETGVRVVSLIDNHEWNETTIKDTTSFMLSVLLFSRAHNESSTKAGRVSAKFQAKRKERLPVVSIGHGPGWAVPKPDRSGWELDAARAESVVKVFEMAAAGHGGIAIARQANQSGWPLPWRVRANTSTRWEHTGVSRLLRDRRTLGEWQPKKMIAGKLTPDGDVEPDYFPRVVSDKLWLRVQAALSGRGGPVRVRGVNADIFAGLLYCRCGERIERKAPAGRGYARYYCLGRKHGASECEGVAESVLLGPLLSAIGQIEQRAFNPGTAAANARKELATNETKLSELRERAERVLDLLEESGGSALLRERLAGIEKDMATAEANIARAKASLGAVPLLDADFGKRLAAEAASVVADKANVEGRLRVSQALWQVAKRIVWSGRNFMVHARSGAAFGVVPPVESLGRAKNRNAGKPRLRKETEPHGPTSGGSAAGSTSLGE